MFISPPIDGSPGGWGKHQVHGAIGRVGQAPGGVVQGVVHGGASTRVLEARVQCTFTKPHLPAADYFFLRTLPTHTFVAVTTCMLY